MRSLKCVGTAGMVTALLASVVVLGVTREASADEPTECAAAGDHHCLAILNASGEKLGFHVYDSPVGGEPRDFGCQSIAANTRMYYPNLQVPNGSTLNIHVYGGTGGCEPGATYHLGSLRHTVDQSTRYQYVEWDHSVANDGAL